MVQNGGVHWRSGMNEVEVGRTETRISYQMYTRRVRVYFSFRSVFLPSLVHYLTQTE